MIELTYEQWVEEYKPIMDGDKAKEFTYNEAQFAVLGQTLWVNSSVNNEDVILDTFTDDCTIYYICNSDYSPEDTTLVHTGITTNDQLLCCPNCGNIDIQTIAAVNVNTKEFIKFIEDKITIVYCNKCIKNYKPIIVKEFNQIK